jgi:hypothetical protein
VTDPFRIEGPACISFSGGRTSAYMLWLIIMAWGGALPADLVVCFANTGKEDEATLRFVRDCAKRWGVTVVWLEYTADEPGFKVVDFETAARNGEPFDAILDKRGFLPNVVTRFCTIELKIRVMARYLLSIGMVETLSEGESFSVMGIRADEQRRAAKIADKSRIPLWGAGITVGMVNAFWSTQPFNLELPTVNGVTAEGNCDLCFLKPPARVVSLIRAKPERAVWWIGREVKASASGASTGQGNRFNKDGPTYAQMAKFAADQGDMFQKIAADDGELLACFCGD